VDAQSEAGWTVLAVARPATADSSVSRVRLYGRVIATAVAVVVAVALLSVFAAKNLAEIEAVKDAAQTADIVADALVQPVISDGLHGDGLLTGDADALAAIDEVVRDHVLGSSIVRVKIWDATGRILYSDEPRLIGQTFALEEEELEVLENPRTDAEVSDVQAPENRYERDSGTLLEVYRPVWSASGDPLLFEAYFRYDEVTERSGQLWQGFAAVTIGSIVLLVLALLPVLRRLLRVLARSGERRETALRAAIDASSNERRRIAGTLHDGVVQDLAATAFGLAGAAERATAPGAPASAAELRVAADTVRGSIGGLRTLLVDIYPPTLAVAGLSAALDDLVARVRARGISVDVALTSGPLDGDDERLVFRVVQECLQNVLAHSGASKVCISLERKQSGIELRIADDGRGFDAAAVLAHPADGHFGLRVLGDLASESGADLAVRTAPGNGTVWRLRMPPRARSEGAE